MPYVKERDRDDVFGGGPDEMPCPTNGGELNFAISTLCGQYLQEQGLCYQNISDVVGALEGAKQEFFRRIVNPYEELKALENGDLPDYEHAEKIIQSNLEKYYAEKQLC